MERKSLLMIGAACLLIGFAVGRSFGSREVEFPEVDQARTAAEMEGAVLDALAEPLASVRASSLARLFEGMTAENAPGAARAVESRAGRWDPVDMQIFLASWVRVDPEAALARVSEWPIQSRREMGLSIGVREWAAGGGWLNAVEYVQTAADPEVRAITLGPLVRGWALSGDVLGAKKQARRIYDLEANPAVVDGLVRGVLHVDGPEGVVALIHDLEGVETDEFDQRVARVGLDLVAREDPRLAGDMFATLSMNGVPSWLEPSVPRIAQIWSNQDPQAATVWLMAVPQSEARDEALARTVADWGIRDFEQVRTWVDQQLVRSPAAPDGVLAAPESILVFGLIPRLSRVDPRAAASWAERLPPGPTRVPMLQRVGRRWLKEDRSEALAWIDGLELTPRARELILKSSPPSP